MGSPETSGFWRGLGQSPRKGLFMTLQQLKYVVEAVSYTHLDVYKRQVDYDAEVQGLDFDDLGDAPADDAE